MCRAQMCPVFGIASNAGRSGLVENAADAVGRWTRGRVAADAVGRSKHGCAAADVVGRWTRRRVPADAVGRWKHGCVAGVRHAD